MVLPVLLFHGGIRLRDPLFPVRLQDAGVIGSALGVPEMHVQHGCQAYLRRLGRDIRAVQFLLDPPIRVVRERGGEARDIKR